MSTIWYQTITMVVIGLLIRRFPILMAGYNTMTAEQKKKTDSKGAANFLCKALCIIALTGIVLFYGLTFAGVGEKTTDILTGTVIPIVGILITLIKIQRFDPN
ncbi:MAG TPA: hypothetical protein DHW74_10075 [Bacteroides stercoris]|nr:hypothetical protein [Bacteroides stercoris]